MSQILRLVVNPHAGYSLTSLTAVVELDCWLQMRSFGFWHAQTVCSDFFIFISRMSIATWPSPTHRERLLWLLQDMLPLHLLPAIHVSAPPLWMPAACLADVTYSKSK